MSNQYIIYNFCLSNAIMHGQNIHSGLPLCVCLRVSHTFCQLAYRSDPSTDLKDADDLCQDVPFGVSMMNNHI